MAVMDEVPYQPMAHAIPKEWLESWMQLLGNAAQFQPTLSEKHSSATKEIREEHTRQQKENLRFMLITIASSAVRSALVSGLFPLLGGSRLIFYEDRDRSGYTFEQREDCQRSKTLTSTCVFYPVMIYLFI